MSWPYGTTAKSEIRVVTPSLVADALGVQSGPVRGAVRQACRPHRQRERVASGSATGKFQVFITRSSLCVKCPSCCRPSGAPSFQLSHQYREPPRSDLALPDHDDAPTSIAQVFLVCHVSSNIPRKFRRPVASVAERNSITLAISVLMPKTSVDEYDRSSAGQYNVGTPWQVAPMKPESQSTTMKSGPDQ